ncbi:unnamed protein product [Rotaria magnacalcarata]|uniref:G-protein coupled receptors family 1 profile domain-containing protein n=1 Tax=Rotaria magnacalcarata TaxID=392030 RepID=A0A816VMX0_9BILA|nr:unnamed protein product [Rotaria magnacalcarata]CAF2126578.1 unnamed protein product [Rotaria magnacalcarata]CAF4074625.1 unnamed protein product [Rotaria magnacalcarata]
MNETYIDNSYLNCTFTLSVHNDLEEFIRYIYMIIYPIIFIIGLIGNLLSSLVFSITELSQNSCGIYFLLLAISDSIALIGGLHHCLTIGYNISIPYAIYCRTRNFLVYTSTDMVSWMIVAISVDRFLKVKFPFKSRIHCTNKLNIKVAGCITIILIVKNIHLASKFIGDFTLDAADNCDPNPAYPRYVHFFENIWPWIDLTTFVLLPFIIVTSCNIFIINDQHKRRLKFGHRNFDRSLTKFLLISSLSLITCNFPVSITIIVYPYISQIYGKSEHYDEVGFIFDILRIPSYATLALNFYLYYYSSSIFRHQALLLFKRLCRIRVHSNEMNILSMGIIQVQSPRQSNLREQTVEK